MEGGSFGSALPFAAFRGEDETLKNQCCSRKYRITKFAGPVQTSPGKFFRPKGFTEIVHVLEQR
jgi:hypothetical protein